MAQHFGVKFSNEISLFFIDFISKIQQMQCGGYGSPQVISGSYHRLQLVFMTFQNIIDWYEGEVTVHQFKIHESMTFEQIDKLCSSFFLLFIQKLFSFARVAFRNFSKHIVCVIIAVNRKPKPKLPISSNDGRHWNANRNSLDKQRLCRWTFFEYFWGLTQWGWYRNVFSNSFETMHVQMMKAHGR